MIISKRIFFHLLIFFLILFCSFSCTKKKEVSKTNLEYLLKVAKIFNNELCDIKNESKKLGNTYAKFYKKNVKGIYPRSVYYRDKNNVLSDHKNQTGSELYVNAFIKDSPSLEKFIAVSDHMKPYWNKVREKYPFIGWQYITDAKTFAMRGFPWSDSARDYVGMIDAFTVDLVKDLNQKNNPELKSKWSPPCTDSAGLGITATVSSPIYYDKKYLGIQSIDLPLKSLFNEVMVSKVKKKYYLLFIITPNNKVFTITNIDGYLNENNKSLLLKKMLNSGELDLKKNITVKKVGSELLKIYLAELKETNWCLAIIK